MPAALFVHAPCLIWRALQKAGCTKLRVDWFRYGDLSSAGDGAIELRGLAAEVERRAGRSPGCDLNGLSAAALAFRRALQVVDSK